MKKLFLSLAVMTALCVGFASCDKDEENASASIVGKWYEYDVEVSGGDCVDADINTNNWVEFYADGTTDSYNSEDNETSKGTWSINGKILTMTDLSFPIPIPAEILELTSTTLAIKVELPCFMEDNNAIAVRTYKKR
jgi:hypothetical protein